MGKKAIVLSSGGIDSTTCLALAVSEIGAENVASITIFYGQKHRVELHAAQAVARHYGVRQFEFDLSQIMRFSNCALLDGSTQEISHSTYRDQGAENGGKVATYVPIAIAWPICSKNGTLQSAYALPAASSACAPK